MCERKTGRAKKAAKRKIPVTTRKRRRWRDEVRLVTKIRLEDEEQTHGHNGENGVWC